MATTFGYSAFLRLVHLNVRPQRTAIKQRLAKGGKGYDFHRRLRRDVGQFFMDEKSLSELLADAVSVKNEPERISIQEGLTRAAQWRSLQRGDFISLSASTYESPHASFRIKFTPDFGFRDASGCVAVHAWNTGKIKLDPRLVYSTLSVFSRAFQINEPKADVALLCLKTMKFYRLAPTPELLFVGTRIMAAIETVFENVRDNVDRPPAPEKRIPPPTST